MNSKPSLIFMGSPQLANIILSELHARQMNLLAIVSQPDKIAGRGQKLSSPPVALFAKQHQLKLFQPTSVKDPSFIKEIKSLNPDFLIVAAYGKILPKEILQIPSKESLNVHFSLLPKYRGASCVASAIKNDEKETGVSIMRMVEALDAGPIFLQKKVPIQDEDNTLSLETKLADLGAKALLEVIDQLNTPNSINPIPQEDTLSSYAPLIQKEDAKINWENPARLVYNHIRAMNPWPIATTQLKGKKYKIHQATLLNFSSLNNKAGEIISIENDYIEVSCKIGTIGLTQIQAESKKKMNFSEFKKGHPAEFQKGDILS